VTGNTGAVAAFTLGSITLTRVPYFDVALGPEVIGFSPQQVDSLASGPLLDLAAVASSIASRAPGQHRYFIST
jgi:hypothetical protein